MKSAIRFALVAVMAVTSTTALAGGSHATSYGTSGGDARQSDATATTSKSDTESQDVGHGSAEPRRSDATTKTDDAMTGDTALREYNQQNFLAQTWMGTP